MATLVVGDVQGCLEALQRLLRLAAFDSARDRLWLLGDVVNRGPDSLGVLRYLRALDTRVQITLGNHDLHLLAVYYAGHPAKPKDTFTDVLGAADCAEHCAWLRAQPLTIFDAEFGCFMSHAGLPHIWSVAHARARAEEVESALRGAGHVAYLDALYGDTPACWDDALVGVPRLRAITNYLTRMRWIQPDGALEFRHKGSLADRPPGCVPWYQLRHPASPDVRVLFGHWAALDGATVDGTNVMALDTGCVWGRRLTALRLDDGACFSVPARPH